MSELLSYDEDAREAVNSVRHCLSGDIGPIRARVLKELADTRDPSMCPGLSAATNSPRGG